MAKRPIGLKTLAAQLGLTVSTVSRALNGYSDINEETRKRVQQAADELGYRPNQTARRLSIGSPETIAYLMPRRTGAIAQPFVAELIYGLGEAVGKRGWDLLVSQASSNKDELAQLDRLVRSGRVGGIVISRPLKNDARVQLLKDLKCPFVVHGRTGSSDTFAWYDVDGEAAMVVAVDHLASLGHQDIAFIGSTLQHQFAQDRLDGYAKGLSQNGLTYRDEVVQIVELNDEGGEIATLQLLDLPKPPQAIICVSDTVALGCLAALRSRGLRPGRDVSVIGYDGLKFGEHTNPPLSTMAQPQAHAGHRLGDMLFAIIEGDDPKNHQELQRAQLVRRNTDGPPRRVPHHTHVSVREETT